MRLTMKLTVAFLFVCCLAGLLWEETVRAGRAVGQRDPGTRGRLSADLTASMARYSFYKGLAPGVRRPRQEHQQSTSETFQNRCFDCGPYQRANVSFGAWSTWRAHSRSRTL